MLCYKAKLASKIANATVATLANANIGDKLDPQPAKHVTHAIKTDNPVFATPGNQFPAPERVDSKKEEMVCLPTTVLGAAPVLP